MAGIWIPKIGIIFIDYLFKLSLLIGIIYGAFRAARDGPTKILIVGSLFMVGVTVIATPNSRYMFPMIPVFIMATSWYGSIIVAFLKKLYPSDEKFVQRVAIAVFAVGILALFYYLIGGVHLDFKNTATNHLKTTVFLVGTVIALFCAFVLIIASRFAKGYLMIAMTRFAHAMPTILLVVLISASTMFSWARILHSAVVDVSSGHLHILEDRKTSMKASFPSLTPIFQDCHGIMSLEPTFFGAFLDMPQSKFFGVWEIPPFGKLGDTAYNGLTPDRIDCVFISNNMATNIGMASNHQIRYQNYIKPYVKQLQTMGAVTYDVPNGQVVVFRNP